MKPEQKARHWRYSSFYAISKWGNYDFLLTGHTLSDSVETTLFNLCRGSGLKGVCSLKEFQTFQRPKNTPKFCFFHKYFGQEELISFETSVLLPLVWRAETKKMKKISKSLILFYDPILLNFKRENLKKKFFLMNPGILERQKLPFFLKKKVILTKKTFSFLSSVIKKTNAGFLFRFKAQLESLREKKAQEKRTFEKPFRDFYSPTFAQDQKPRVFAKKVDGPFFNENKLYIIRPLIKINRDTLSLFVKKLYLPIYYDKSNRDLKITRNYIRKIILPLLKKINPRFEKNIYKFSKIVEFYYSKVGNIECPAELFDSFE